MSSCHENEILLMDNNINPLQNGYLKNNIFIFVSHDRICLVDCINIP